MRLRFIYSFPRYGDRRVLAFWWRNRHGTWSSKVIWPRDAGGRS